MLSGPFRSIVWCEPFEKELAEIEPDPKKADAVLSVIEKLLSRAPEKGRHFDGTHVWGREADYIAKKLRLFVYYTFDDQTVYVLSIQRIKANSIWR